MSRSVEEIEEADERERGRGRERERVRDTVESFNIM